MKTFAIGFMALIFGGTDNLTFKFETKTENSAELRREISFKPRNESDTLVNRFIEQDNIDTLKPTASMGDAKTLKSEAAKASINVPQNSTVYESDEEEMMEGISDVFTEYGLIGGLMAIVALFAAFGFVLSRK